MLVVLGGWRWPLDGCVFRAELRRRWRAWLALALIVGAFAGVVEAAAAGARRTDAAYPSLLAWSDAPDVLLFSFAGDVRDVRPVLVRGQRRPSAGAPGPPILVGYPVASPAAAQVIAPESDAGAQPVLAPPDPVRPPA